MAVYIELDDYPTPVRASVVSPSNEQPAVITVDCIPAFDQSEPLPTTTELRLYGINFTGTWSVQCVKGPVLAGNAVRFTFTDSRIALSKFTMTESFNRRTSEGKLDEGNKKTITELWAELASVTGLTFTVESSRDFYPPAPWFGKTSAQAIANLLAFTGSRMVHDPATNTFKINLADKGSTLDFSERFLQPNKSPAFNKLSVHSGPILYEGLVSCRADWIDDSGSLSALPDPQKAFLGYNDEVDARRRSRLVQSAFRVWSPQSISHPSGHSDGYELTDHRAICIGGSASSPIFASASVRNESGHWCLAGTTHGAPDARRPIWRGDSGVYTTDAAVIVVNDSGVLQTTIDIEAAYRLLDPASFNGYASASEQIVFGAGTSEKFLVIPSIQPVDSDLADGPDGDDWSALLTDIAEANRKLMSGRSQRAMLPGPHHHHGSGRIAKASWFAQLSPPRVTTEFVIDSPPATNPQYIQ